jgi:hypothetical protein
MNGTTNPEMMASQKLSSSKREWNIGVLVTFIADSSN